MLNRTRTLAAELIARDLDLGITGYSKPEFSRIVKRRRRVSVKNVGVLHVVEGDLLVDDDELAIYTLRNQKSPPAPSIRLGESDLVGISVSNEPVRWDEGVVLTYCVLRKSFPSEKEYRLARDSLADAARAWEEVCDVEFSHRDEFDGHPNVSAAPPIIDSSLVFAARYLDAQGTFVAASFFPTQPPDRRKVLFDPSYFSKRQKFDQTGILRHELGHVLGFRHEHIRSGAPAVCPDEETADLFPFNEYDPASVMHYFCGGVGSSDLTLTEQDRLGAQALYGSPRETAAKP